MCNMNSSLSGDRIRAGIWAAAALAPYRDFGFLGPMDENTGAVQKSPREERLAKALRDNLRRRKAQARERAAGSQPDEAGHAGSQGQMSEREG
jgi:hypothetical protein